MGGKFVGHSEVEFLQSIVFHILRGYLSVLIFGH